MSDYTSDPAARQGLRIPDGQKLEGDTWTPSAPYGETPTFETSHPASDLGDRIEHSALPVGGGLPRLGRRTDDAGRAAPTMRPTVQTRFWIACGTLLAIGCVILACSSPKPQSATTARELKTWGGDLTPVVSVKELMHDMIDPLADNIFDAVGTVVNRQGIRDWEPRTDKDWAKVRIGAVSMAEGIYLLKIPRPFVPPGQEHLIGSPDDLTPAESKAKVEKDPVLWQAKIEVLRNVGREVLEIVDKKDAKAMWGAAEDLDGACEGCHLEFWYPRQRDTMRRLHQKRLDAESQESQTH